MLSKSRLVNRSKFLSLILRHNPGKFGIVLDQNGWADVKAILKATELKKSELDYVVENNNKKRFLYSDDGKSIRAVQGHSIKVDLQLEATEPPEILYHGTAKRSIPAIRENGLKSQGRHDVHLSKDYLTAKKVGKRHGKPKVLIIKSKEMHEAGYDFYLTENGVWLTNNVPTEFIEGID